MAARTLTPGWYVVELAFDRPTTQSALEAALPAMGFSNATFDAVGAVSAAALRPSAAALAPAATSAAAARPVSLASQLAAPPPPVPPVPVAASAARPAMPVTATSIAQAAAAASPAPTPSRFATTVQTTLDGTTLTARSNVQPTMHRPALSSLGPVNTSFRPAQGPAAANQARFQQAVNPSSLASPAGPRLNLGPPGGGGGGGGDGGSAGPAAPGGYDYSAYTPPTGGSDGGGGDAGPAGGGSDLTQAAVPAPSGPSNANGLDLSKCYPIDASGRFYLCPAAPGSGSISGVVIGGASSSTPWTYQFVAHLDRPMLTFDQPGMTWRDVRPLAIDPTAVLNWQVAPFVLMPGVTYDFRFFSRDKTASSHGDVEKLLEAMGWAVGALLLVTRNMRVPGRPNTSVSEWIGSATWTRPQSIVTAYEPFYFADLKESVLS